MKKKVFTVLILFIICLLIMHGREAIIYTHNALSICYEMIIPSLFPFFVCSGMLIYSGFCEWLSEVFRPFMMPLFGINASGSSAFIIGIISGYPAGAVTVCQLYKSMYISKSEAERLLAFSNNSGPLFILCSLGIGLYSDIKIGIILYTAHIISAFLVGILLKLFSKPIYNPPVGSVQAEEKTIGEIFSLSLSSSINSILTVCGAIVFFSVVSSLILDLIPEFPLKSLLYGIMEFAGGNAAISKSCLPFAEKLILASFITGFAGLCVHLQVISVTAAYGLSIKTYLIGKLFHAILAASFTAAALNLTKLKEAVSIRLGYSFFMNSAFVLIPIFVIFILCLILKLPALTGRHRRPKHSQCCSPSADL